MEIKVRGISMIGEPIQIQFHCRNCEAEFECKGNEVVTLQLKRTYYTHVYRCPCCHEYVLAEHPMTYKVASSGVFPLNLDMYM